MDFFEHGAGVGELLHPPVELALPSDHDHDPDGSRDSEARDDVNALKSEIEMLKAKLSGTQMRNVALQRRMTDIMASWRQTQTKLRTHETSDVICDYISEWYHSDLLRFLVSNTDPSKRARLHSWNAVSEQLAEEAHESRSELKHECMALAQMTEEEWDAICLFKKSRNLRVHPRRNRGIVQRVMRELPAGTLKAALAKMFNTMRGIK